MVQKKYKDIERLKDKYAGGFTKGEHITITEKIDGANASIRCDEEGNVICFSRRNELTPFNTLQGFYEYVQAWDKTGIVNTLGTRYILFGEWLCKHSIRYPENRMKQFYVFDVWDTETEEYLPWERTRVFAGALGFKTVPLFFDGEFTTWEDVYAFVGKTEMDAEPSGEGIVIKSQDRLDNKSSRTPEYVKIVAKEFSEVHKSKEHKEIDTEALAAREAAKALAMTIVTERRVQKGLEKLVEDDIIPVDWDEHNLGTIAKNLPRAIYNDCVKEEPETVAQIEDFGKICAGISMEIARGLIK